MQGGLQPLCLFYQDNVHFDLLLKANSRFALLGLRNERIAEKRNNFVFKSVTFKEPEVEEQLLMDVDQIDHVDLQVEGSGSEVEGHTIAQDIEKSKTDNQECSSKEDDAKMNKEDEVLNSSFKCHLCNEVFNSNYSLINHMKTHSRTKPVSQIFCNSCDTTFETQENKNEHDLKYHEWNCNDCSYQTNNRSDLFNHLQLTCHQPSGIHEVTSNNFVCSSCDGQFESSQLLRNHIKANHKADEICRYFLRNNCKFDDKCWYAHPNLMSSGLVCYKCGNGFPDFDSLMHHKKSHHAEKYPCKNYMKGSCKRNESDCWYSHEDISNPEFSAITKETKSFGIKNSNAKQTEPQDFQRSNPHPLPPENVDRLFPMMRDLYSKVQTIETFFQELMN